MNSFVHTTRPIAIGYPCTLYRKFSKSMPSLYHNYNNAGDCFAKEGTFDRHRHADERECLGKIADIWNVDIEKCWGYTTSGGSEGNLQGLWIARQKYPDGILYYSDQAHYSIKKIATILRMKSVVVPSDATGAMNVRALECALDLGKPVIILANIGSTFLGAIDDVRKIKHVLNASTNRVYVHADAAFFGFVMPYLHQGYDDYKYIDSISVSAHKWPGVPFPGGVFMSIKEHVRHVENFEEVIAQRDVTVSGSRNGHTALFLNEFFDTVDLEKDVEQCLEMTEYLYDRLWESAPACKPWKNERSPIVVFDSPSSDIIKKWSLASVGKRSHVCVLPHITKKIADAFVHDMSKNFERRQTKK
ncbi:histidine decarboxylase [Paramecium bursaria Chlorella virus NE-JV-1]|nr:histidine decarboxylase [Paramecium bursaria Chlorella virus NE-JV-1]